MYARHNVQWLLQNQEFALMIDAHSEFEVLLCSTGVFYELLKRCLHPISASPTGIRS